MIVLRILHHRIELDTVTGIDIHDITPSIAAHVQRALDQAGLGANEAGDEFGLALAGGDFNKEGACRVSDLNLAFATQYFCCTALPDLQTIRNITQKLF